jgi:solute carrier family 25 protein 38
MNHAFAGFISSGFCSLFLQPLDVLKTRSQQSPKLSYRILAKDLIQCEGISGFWKGTGVSLVRSAFGSAAYFSILFKCKGLLRENFIFIKGESLTEAGNFAIGAFARAAAGLSNMPFTLLKTRFESTNFQYNSIWKALVEVGSKEGISALFKGYFWCIARDAPQSGIFLLVYRKIQSKFTANTEFKQTLSNVISAFAAGAAACTITQPFDTIKTYVQLQKRNTTSFSTAFIFSNGPFGLFKGLMPRIARKSLSSAITWTIYEHLTGIAK